MRLQLSSRTDSKKSRRRVILLLAIGLLATPAPLFGEIEHVATVRPTTGFLTVTINATGADPRILFGNLADGLTARLEFAIRVLEARGGPLAFFGNRLIDEYRVIYTMRYDPFRERFTVTTQDGGFFTFRDEGTARAFFFSLPGYRVPWSSFDTPRTQGGDDFVVETRVTYDPIVFAPGLSILSVFLPSSRHQSSWISTPVEVDS